MSIGHFTIQEVVKDLSIIHVYSSVYVHANEDIAEIRYVHRVAAVTISCQLQHSYTQLIANVDFAKTNMDSEKDA